MEWLANHGMTRSAAPHRRRPQRFRRPRRQGDQCALAQQFTSRGQVVVEVPFDPHLRPGGVIDCPAGDVAHHRTRSCRSPPRSPATSQPGSARADPRRSTKRRRASRRTHPGPPRHILGPDGLEVRHRHRASSVRCWAATRESRSRSARSTTLRANRPFCMTSMPCAPSGAR